MSLVSISLSGMNTGDFTLACGLRHLYLPQLTRHAASPTNLLSYWIKICSFEIFSWYVWKPFYLYYNQLESMPREIAVPSTRGPMKGNNSCYSATTIRALLISSLSLQTHSNLEWAGTLFFFPAYIEDRLGVCIGSGPDMAFVRMNHKHVYFS